MAFDQTTRNRLQRFVSDARATLTEEFTRQLQNEYGLDPVSASVTPMERLSNLDDARRETAQILRDTLEHYRQTSPTEDLRSLLDRIVREHAFTVLNRLAALRMAEARGLLIESLANGYNSKGFQLYARLAGTGLGERGDAYRSYLFSLFDEFALDLRVLFDRFSPTGRLFPREPALLETLALMNDPEIAPLWAEDETIGWIYQYFNSKEERKKMRDESAAPRNSRELAVRNQFFTPRYVVEFLTDNTLGRIWYEMTRGETRLKDQCRYLVRRPTETFLNPGQEPPASDESSEQNLSQEELLRQPVFIPHRPLKDPREIRVLDPACGSMHFGLYAFDLLETIYEESWDWEAPGVAPSIERSSELKPLRETYADKEAFLRDAPRLIIEHNLHGIDIDPRAVQIAGLSLWLRAQRAWQQQRIKAADRPRILRSNIVCAEPMPGEESLLNEFIERHLSATPELRLVAQLVRRVFKAMKLAGEAGSLLKIEEEVAGAVAEAREQWLDEIKKEQGQGALFADLAKHEQRSLDFEVAEITDETFWERAESSIYAALREYAEQAENGGGYQRRLFAEDAARGFAFIDVCRNRYDVVLMNPPFGAETLRITALIEKYWTVGRHDLATAFVTQSYERLVSLGSIGVIMTRTPFFLSRFTEWRSMAIFHEHQPLTFFSDLGQGVLDSAMVEAVAAVFSRGIGQSLAFDFRTLGGVEIPADKFDLSGAYQFSLLSLRDVPNRPLAYWVPPSTLSKFAELGLYSQASEVKQGLATKDNDRYVRLWWEVPNCELSMKGQWRAYAKGGEYAKFYLPLQLVVDWSESAQTVYRMRDGQMVVLLTRKKDQYLHRPAITYSKRSQLGFSARILPCETVFSPNGPGIFPDDPKRLYHDLAFLNCSFSRACLEFLTSFGSYSEGYVESLPFSLPMPESLEQVTEISRRCVLKSRGIFELDENCREFSGAVMKNTHSLASQEQENFSKLKQTTELLAESFSQLDGMFSNILSLTQEDISFAHTNAYEGPLFSDDEDESRELSKPSVGHAILSLSLGFAYGRWDIRVATSEKPAPELPDPFAPLPVCPPGMLQNERGLPAEPSDVPSSYPLRISWPGILVDDKGHAEDIERRVREALQVIWQERADAIEQEACEILGVKTLRDYFRKPAGFFADHLKRYSKSRRQAPIYWPLSTRSGEYTLWLYYHRLNDQTLYACVNNFVEPKLRQVSESVNQLRGKGSDRTRDEEKEFERMQDFEHELQEFRDELLRLAKLPWRPNLNDGVQITAAPLWKLFRLPKWQKALKETWQSLEKGEYDWAHLAMTVWPERVVPKCAKDRSLAIAHGVEDLFWVEDEGRWRVIKSPKEELEEQKRRQRSETRERAKRLLCELAQSEDGRLSAADVGNRLASGGYDDRELALLIYPNRLAEKCWEDVTLARRLGLSHPTKKTKAARDKFIKEIATKGCADIAPMVEAALDGRAKSFAEVWREIESGERDDLALALALWPDRVVDKCAEDRGLAEHHGLRKFFWVRYPAEEWRRRLSIEEEISNEIEWRRCIAAGLVSTPSFQAIS